MGRKDGSESYLQTLVDFLLLGLGKIPAFSRKEIQSLSSVFRSETVFGL